MKLVYLLLFLSFTGLCHGNWIPRHINRIANGNEAAEHEFPYLVSVQAVQIFSGATHVCGGVIINENFILTAAQCVNMIQPSNLRVITGEHDLSVVSSSEQTLTPKSYVIHEQYSHNPLQNDIALIKLKSSLTMIPGVVESINLASTEVSPGTECLIAGWGQLDESNPDISNKVHKAKVPIISAQDCREMFSPDYTVLSSMLCAGDSSIGHCIKDEGGPLVCDGELSGIISYGRGCARDDSPGVFSAVHYFNDWIKQSKYYLNHQDDSVIQEGE